jgi:hypothetical protein
MVVKKRGKMRKETRPVGHFTFDGLFHGCTVGFSVWHLRTMVTKAAESNHSALLCCLVVVGLTWIGSNFE